MKNILFCIEKWVDGKPEMGFSSSVFGLIETFQQSVTNYKIHSIFFDESYITYKKHIDDSLMEYCSNNNIDCIIMSLLGGSAMNPSSVALQKIKERGIKLCIIWPDTPPFINLDANIDLHVSVDHPKSNFHQTLLGLNNYLSLWMPQNSHYFFSEDEKTIDVSFVGSIDGYRDRVYFLDYLKEQFPQIQIRGGQRREGLSNEQFSEIIRKSKITINFPINQSGVFYQAKNRIFEAVASKTLLLDLVNPSSDDFFVDGSEYVSFSNQIEMVDNIKNLLSDDKKRLQIAENGYNKYMQNYTAKHFWGIVLYKLELL